MTNATLRGKPDAGNPHVRFDEGEVASAKPRRGSLLYNLNSKKNLVPGMFSRSLRLFQVLAIVCVAGVAEVGAVTTWTGAESTDWSNPKNWNPEGVPTACDVKIPTGKEVYVDDASLSSVESLTKLTLDEKSTNIFATTRAPVVAFGGRGVILKRGTSSWELTQQQKIFYGGWIVESGVVTVKGNLSLVYPWVWDTMAGELQRDIQVVVNDGAQLVFDCATSQSLGQRTLCLNGTGPDGQGALVCTSAGGTVTTSRLKLLGDATIKSAKTFYLDVYASDPAVSLDLNGHTLTLNMASGIEFQAAQCTFKGAGHIHLADGAGIAFSSRTNYIYKYTGLLTDGFCKLDETADFAVSLGDGSCVTSYNDVPSLPIPLQVRANATATLRHGHNRSWKDVAEVCSQMQPGTNDWTGAITLAEGSVLKIGTGNYGYGEKGTRVSGSISGSGGVEYLSNGLAIGKVCVAGSNSYTGLTTLNVNNGEGIIFETSNAAPVYANVRLASTASGVKPLTLAVVPGLEHGWTASSLAQFLVEAPAGSIYNWTAIDLSRATNNVNLDFATKPAPVDGIYPIGRINAGEAVLGVTGITNAPVLFTVASGTVKVADMATCVVTGRMDKLSSPATGTGEILVDNVDHLSAASYPFALGDGFNARTWRLRNTHAGEGDANWSPTSTTMRAIQVGRYGASEAALILESGAVVTGKFHVGYGTATSRGRITVKDGARLALIGCANDSGTNKLGQSTSPSWGSCIGREGRGSLTVEKGAELTTYGTFEVGTSASSMQGVGSIWLKGGRWNGYEHPLNGQYTSLYDLGRGSAGQLLISDGGTLTNALTTVLCRSGRTNDMASCNVTVTGSGSCLKTKSLDFGYYTGGWRANINVNDGGTIEALYIHQRWTNGLYWANGAVDANMVANVGANGGRFRFGSSYYSLFSLDHKAFSATDPSLRKPIDVRVYEKGVILDTAYGSTLRQSLKAATGKGLGVDRIDIAAQAGYMAAPYVRIEGDGAGATLFPETDDAGNLTGFIVTSRGWNYTWLKVYYSTPTSSGDICLDCTSYLADNAQIGSFTKEGVGTLTVVSTNTYGGATILKEGTLKMGVNGALPADSTFVLAGGKLDMGGCTFADGSALPKKWAVDAANGPVTYPGDLTFPAGATLEILNEEAGTRDGKSVNLLTVTGTLTGAPALPTLDTPRYKLFWSGNVLRLSRIRGFIVTLH